MYAWGKKVKVSFSRVYVCVKAKLTLVSFFLTFFSMHLSLSDQGVKIQNTHFSCFSNTSKFERIQGGPNRLKISKTISQTGGLGSDRNSKTTFRDHKYTSSLEKMAPETTPGRLIFFLKGKRSLSPNFCKEQWQQNKATIRSSYRGGPIKIYQCGRLWEFDLIPAQSK